MANIIYSRYISGYDVDDFFGSNKAMSIRLDTGKSATFECEGGCSIRVGGNGFLSNGTNLTAGTINNMVLLDDRGRVLATVKDLEIGAKYFSKTIDSEADFTNYFYNILPTGNDHITGSATSDFLVDNSLGDDVIRGFDGPDILGSSKGNDTLFGGGASDVFLFTKGFGEDAIMDFDASGNDQDHIRVGKISYSSIQIDQVGKNVEVDLGHGDIITIYKMDFDLIAKEDFILS